MGYVARHSPSCRRHCSGGLYLRCAFLNIENKRWQDPNSGPYVANQVCQIDFNNFKQHPNNSGRSNVKQILSYSKKYGHIVQTRNASELPTLTDSKRHHIMESLTYLSRYLGCYGEWKAIREQYQLK